MKRTGPPPKPTALKILQGNPGRRPLNSQEAQAETKIPPCPPELSAEAKKEWRRISKQLARLNLLAEIDRAALAGYCQNYATWIECSQLVQKDGLVMMSPSGYLIPSPYLSIGRKAHDAMLKILTEFGMTPASRSRIKVGEPPAEKSPLDKFRKKQA